MNDAATKRLLRTSLLSLTLAFGCGGSGNGDQMTGTGGQTAPGTGGNGAAGNSGSGGQPVSGTAGSSAAGATGSGGQTASGSGGMGRGHQREWEWWSNLLGQGRQWWRRLGG